MKKLLVALGIVLVASVAHGDEIIKKNRWLNRWDVKKDHFSPPHSYMKRSMWEDRVIEVRDADTHELKGRLEYNPWFEDWEIKGE